MLPQEVITVESDAKKLSAGHPAAKIKNHRILNGGVTQIPSGIRSQQSNPGACP
jgi:hypothetical protein